MSRRSVGLQLASLLVLVLGLLLSHPVAVEAAGGPVCPNGSCEAGEDCSNCSADCGSCPPVCGANGCEGGENSCNCESDCPGYCCGERGCEGGKGENCCNCSADCGKAITTCVGF